MLNNTKSSCITLCIARHMARLSGANQATAITRCARKLKNETRDVKLFELLKFYTKDLAPATVEGKRLTGDELKIMSVDNLEAGMRAEGLL